MAHAYRNYVPAFAKPKDKPRMNVAHVRVTSDGREKCIVSMTSPEGAEGRAEYKRRIKAMWERQGGTCCFYGFLVECPGSLTLREATFDHENKRGAGRRDDRILVPDPVTGGMKWQNGASHWTCNGIAGSRFIDYNRG